MHLDILATKVFTCIQNKWIKMGSLFNYLAREWLWKLLSKDSQKCPPQVCHIPWFQWLWSVSAPVACPHCHGSTGSLGTGPDWGSTSPTHTRSPHPDSSSPERGVHATPWWQCQLLPVLHMVKVGDHERKRQVPVCPQPCWPSAALGLPSDARTITFHAFLPQFPKCIVLYDKYVIDIMHIGSVPLIEPCHKVWVIHHYSFGSHFAISFGLSFLWAVRRISD